MQSLKKKTISRRGTSNDRPAIELFYISREKKDSIPKSFEEKWMKYCGCAALAPIYLQSILIQMWDVGQFLCHTSNMCTMQIIFFYLSMCISVNSSQAYLCCLPSGIAALKERRKNKDRIEIQHDLHNNF